MIQLHDQISHHCQIYLKISKDDNFYNKVEANNSMNTKYSDIFPKVFDAADDFSWILSERVRVITDYTEFLDWFPETGYKFKNTLSSSLRPFWQALKLSVRKLNKKDETYSQENLISGFGKLVKKLNKSMLFNRIVSASAEVDIDVEDIDIGNVGVATREDRDYFVILDASIFKK